MIQMKSREWTTKADSLFDAMKDVQGIFDEIRTVLHSDYTTSIEVIINLEMKENPARPVCGLKPEEII